VHGGAIPAESFPSRYEEREVFAHETKMQLAEKALTLLREGQVLLFDGGTTNLELARRVPPELRLTVFTNSLPVAEAFAAKPGSELIFLGGRLLRNPRVTVGPEVIGTLGGLRADLCFLGARSLHPQLGVSELDWDETLVKRAMAAAALETAVLAIEEKFGAAQPYIVCPPGRLSFLISPLERRDPRLGPFQQFGVECLSP
jgi:DeoR/GlpR family transcriptional regulator of sugar metabolism